MSNLRFSSPRPHLTPAAAAVRLALAAAVLGAPAAYAQTAGAEPAPLQEVKIVGTAERGYDVKSMSTATKTDTLLRDTPQAITVVTRELIRDQAMQSMADVIRYVPGVVTAQGEGNRDTAVFRGNSSTGDFFVDGIRDDVQYYRDFYNIDSVEALKGSNAMVFGRGGSGGVINRVTRPPEWATIREGSLTIGSYQNRRATADVGQAINDSVAFRVNAMVEDSDSYRNGVFIKRKGINPTVAIRAGANTSVMLGYEHFRDDRTADRGITSFNGKPVDVDPGTFFGNAGLSPTWARVDAFTASIEHDLGNGAMLRNRTRYADYDKFYQNVFASTAVNGAQKLNLAAYNTTTQRTNLFNQTDLTFFVLAGGIEHKLATGLEFGRQQTDNLRTTGFFGNTAAAFEVPLAQPAFNGAITFRPNGTDANNSGTATVASVYVQDQLEFSRQWQAIVGLRYDRFNVDFTNNRDNGKFDITDNKVSPRVGLVYKPIEAVSVYGSYSLAFVPRAGDQLSSLTATTAAFEPEKFKNLEIGAKWDIRPNLSATAAVYQLDRKNVVVADPANPSRSILVPDGQRSKGVELGLGGNVTPQWSVMGGYAYQDARLTAAVSPAIPAGTIVPQVPRHSLSLWNRYDFSPTFGAGLGVAYRDAIYASNSNAVTLPAFTRVDAALYYAISKQYKVQLNVENLFDKRYYASANSDSNITPGSPRAVRMSLNAKF
ncbi:MAG: TonB-dependent siderophore receptor [Massilia sp.]|nr:TonB-dependent siderophore receptor [Massilia sp.]